MNDHIKRPVWDDGRERTPWRCLSQEQVFKSPWITVESHDVIAPTGKPARYGLVRFANRAVGVLPLFDDGTVALVGQMRFPFGAYSWEMPEGGVPAEEDPMEGARRELREETGLEAADMRLILDFDISNSVTDEVAIIYLATGLTQTAETEPDDTENLDSARVPFSQLLEAVIKGQVRDGLTVAAVLRVHHMAVSGELPRTLSDAILR